MKQSDTPLHNSEKRGMSKCSEALFEENHILGFAENWPRPVFYGTKQVKYLSIRQADLQLFSGYHIIPGHFVRQGVKTEISQKYILHMCLPFYLAIVMGENLHWEKM